jgi:hypothetical protein
MYNFYERLDKLIKFDKIRFYKILEIFQYSFILLLLLVIFEFLLNKFYFSKFNLKNEINDKDDKTHNIIKLFLSVFRDTFLIIIILFYIRKIALLFPSIPYLIDNSFKEHTTLEFSIHIALVVVFIEFLPGYLEKIDELRNRISDY